MPIYTFKCDDCGKEFDVLKNYGDNHISECEDASCKSKSFTKKISRPSVIFKGEGFYSTDSKSK